MTDQIKSGGELKAHAIDAANKLAEIPVKGLAVGEKPYVILHALDRDAICDLLISLSRAPSAVDALVSAAQRVLDGGYVSEHIEEERDDHLALKDALAALSRTPAKAGEDGVTQADREAARAWMKQAISDGLIRRGNHNDIPLAQAFAAHRRTALSSIEEPRG